MSERAKQKALGRRRRHTRVRKKVRGTAARPRLSVHRSNKHMTAQLIDDSAGVTLAAASTREADLAGSGLTVEIATRIGTAIGERAKAAGIEKVAFDRGGYRYHGRVAALAEAARQAGLEF